MTSNKVLLDQTPTEKVDMEGGIDNQTDQQTK